MNRRGYLTLTLAAVSMLTGGFATVAWIEPLPRLLWNASASAPVGLYRLHIGKHAACGELAAILPPPALARLMDKRRYLPKGVPLLKRIAARPGQRVCRHGPHVSIDGTRVAVALSHDRSGRPLPVWHGCRAVPPHRLFVINAAPDSFDSRYFGAVPEAGLLGRAQPLLTRDAPGNPFLWRGLGKAAFSLGPNKDHSPCK